MGITDVVLAIFPVIGAAVKSGAPHPGDKGIASGPLSGTDTFSAALVTLSCNKAAMLRKRCLSPRVGGTADSAHNQQDDIEDQADSQQHRQGDYPV